MVRQAARTGTLASLPLSVECFIVSRGWQVDQNVIDIHTDSQVPKHDGNCLAPGPDPAEHHHDHHHIIS